MAGGLWFGTVLSGRIAVDSAPLGAMEWRGGSATSFWTGSYQESHHTALQDGEIGAVFVRVDTEDVETLLGSQILRLCSTKHALAISEGSSARLMRMLGWQMLACTLKGAPRRCYIVGKALELVAHALTATEERSGTPTAPTSGGWNMRDVERIYEARAIIAANLENPPTVPELARAVGLNPRKLGCGFVDHFGEPVYAYVKSRRFEAARALLEAGETSVSHVAHTLGYRPSHFATEFRKRYGMPPSALTGRH